MMVKNVWVFRAKLKQNGWKIEDGFYSRKNSFTIDIAIKMAATYHDYHWLIHIFFPD